MIPVSGRLWKSKGRVSCHSIEVGIWGDEIKGRWAANASHKIKIKYSRAVKEIREPKDDTMFHFV